jgi:Uma2 family endonuclease
MTDDDFDRRCRELPEPKLELLDGRLTVGNGAGNMQLLRHVLDGWGAEAAVPMAPEQLWWLALSNGFRHLDPPAPGKSMAVWHAWAAQVSYTPNLSLAGPMRNAKHAAARERLMMGLYGLAREHNNFARVSGRDVVMRLGRDAFTPDVFAISPRHEHRLNDHYLSGPADLVIEILLPGHEAYDRDVKRLRYEAGGVREYWIMDPVRRKIEFLRITDDGFRPCALDADGKYRPGEFPGLAFQPARLWEGNSWGHGPNPFTIETEMPGACGGKEKGGEGWGDLTFDPRPEIEPLPLSFDEFISWAPEAKFELIDGKAWVGGSRGSRNVIGLLLRTEGLAQAVTVLHPSKWIAALALAEEERTTDAERRAHWWGVARRVANELRNRFGYGRLVVIGDLVRSRPLNLWSDITLIVFDTPKGRSTWDASRFLYERYRDEPDINLLKHEHASRSEQEEVAAAGTEV